MNTKVKVTVKYQSAHKLSSILIFCGHDYPRPSLDVITLYISRPTFYITYIHNPSLPRMKAAQRENESS